MTSSSMRFYCRLPRDPADGFTHTLNVLNFAMLAFSIWGAVITTPHVEAGFGSDPMCATPLFACGFIASWIPLVIIGAVIVFLPIMAIAKRFQSAEAVEVDEQALQNQS